MAPTCATILLALLASGCAATGRYAAVSAETILLSDYAASGSAALGSDPDVAGWGMEAHYLQLGPDISGGFQGRHVGDAHADEVFAGVRAFVLDSPALSPYISLRVRQSTGIDVSGSDNYTGWAAGAGAFVWLGERVFVDLRVDYEDLFGDPDVFDGATRLQGLLGTVGLGYAF